LEISTNKNEWNKAGGMYYLLVNIYGPTQLTSESGRRLWIYAAAQLEHRIEEAARQMYGCLPLQGTGLTCHYY
jgi:hypothetical protein